MFNSRNTDNEKSGSTRTLSGLPALTPLPSPPLAGTGNRISLSSDLRKTFKERFVSTRPQKLRSNRKRPIQEQLVSDPSELAKDISPSTWVRRLQPMPKSKKRTTDARLAGVWSSFRDSGNDNRREVSRWSLWSTSQTSPKSVSQQSPPPLPNSSQLINKPPPSRKRQLLPPSDFQTIPLYPDNSVPSDVTEAPYSPQFARQATRRDGTPRSLTPIPSPMIGLALTSPRQPVFQQFAVDATPVSPPSSWKGKVPLPPQKQKQWE